MIGHGVRADGHSCAAEVGYKPFFMVHSTERGLGIRFRELLQQRTSIAHRAFNLPESIAAMKKEISHFPFPISNFRIRTLSLSNANRIQRSDFRQNVQFILPQLRNTAHQTVNGNKGSTIAFSYQGL